MEITKHWQFPEVAKCKTGERAISSDYFLSRLTYIIRPRKSKLFSTSFVIFDKYMLKSTVNFEKLNSY